MLNQDDLGKIKRLLQPLVKKLASLEDKIEKMAADIKDLRFETKAIHLIISNERKEFEERLERLEESTN